MAQRSDDWVGLDGWVGNNDTFDETLEMDMNHEQAESIHLPLWLQQTSLGQVLSEGLDGTITWDREEGEEDSQVYPSSPSEGEEKVDWVEVKMAGQLRF